MNIIHEFNYRDHIEPVVAGETVRRGLIPRDYAKHPIGCYKSAQPYHAVDMPVIPRSEWSQRLKDQTAAKARLSDIRMRGNGGGMVPSSDQNGRGYCWAHSTVSAVMILRAVANEPYVGLSAYAVACIIKSYADEGGWGAESLDFITERGVPSEQFWPMRSVSRSNDNPATWENAALHKVTEGWVDLQAAQYDRNLTFEQFASCWLSGIPTVDDHNWWSHSICGIDLVEGASLRSETRMPSGKKATTKEFDIIWDMDNNHGAGGFGGRILNSWGNDWEDNGMGVLAGSKAVPDGGAAPRVTGASAA